MNAEQQGQRRLPPIVRDVVFLTVGIGGIVWSAWDVSRGGNLNEVLIGVYLALCGVPGAINAPEAARSLLRSILGEQSSPSSSQPERSSAPSSASPRPAGEADR